MPSKDYVIRVNVLILLLLHILYMKTTPFCVDGLWPCCGRVMATFPQAICPHSRNLLWLQQSTVVWLEDPWLVNQTFGWSFWWNPFPRDRKIIRSNGSQVQVVGAGGFFLVLRIFKRCSPMGTMRSLPRRASALLSALEENLVVSVSVAPKKEHPQFIIFFPPKIWWFYPNIFMFFWDDMGWLCRNCNWSSHCAWVARWCVYSMINRRYPGIRAMLSGYKWSTWRFSTWHAACAFVVPHRTNGTRRNGTSQLRWTSGDRKGSKLLERTDWPLPVLDSLKPILISSDKKSWPAGSHPCWRFFTGSKCLWPMPFHSLSHWDRYGSKPLHSGSLN